MQLTNESKNQVIASKILQAQTFSERSVGLLKHKSLPLGETLWIHRCNSIHTFFMKFAIDAVFVDKNLKVKAIYRNLKPWRMTRPMLSAKSVFEFATGSQSVSAIELGDQLNVGH